MKTQLALILLFLVNSCTNPNLFQLEKQVDDKEDSFEHLSKSYTPILSPDDKITISVWDHDDMSVGSIFSIYNTNESFGKWLMIEKDSTVTIPQIGSLKLGGLSIDDAEDSIRDKLKETIINPLVELKVLNSEITILGEAVKPGKYILEKDINTLVEMLGSCEGMTSFAKKTHIQIIRNNISYRVDLTKMNQFQLSNIIVKSKDIIYIPAVKMKRLHERAPTLIPFATLLTSVGVLISVLGK